MTVRLSVSNVPVGPLAFAGRAPGNFSPEPVMRLRHLDSTAIRRHLPRPVAPAMSLRIQLISDLSGSMHGGNDAAGLRHESALIALEHLAAGQRRRAPWEVEVLSFDLNSAIDFGPAMLDRKGLAEVGRALLTNPSGGSSELGPSLIAADRWSGPRVLAVMSDMELFDSDVKRVLDRFIRSTAIEVVALVFRSAPPPQIIGTRVRVVHVDPRTTPPADIARHLVEAANAAALAANGGEK